MIAHAERLKMEVCRFELRADGRLPVRCAVRYVSIIYPGGAGSMLAALALTRYRSMSGKSITGRSLIPYSLSEKPRIVTDYRDFQTENSIKCPTESMFIPKLSAP